MFKNRTGDNLNNICGRIIYAERRKLNISQRQLADKLQLIGLDVDKNVIQRIECGKRFVTDIELVAISKCLNVTLESLLVYKNIEQRGDLGKVW